VEARNSRAARTGDAGGGGHIRAVADQCDAGGLDGDMVATPMTMPTRPEPVCGYLRLTILDGTTVSGALGERYAAGVWVGFHQAGSVW
jgi:hypothetical protein